MKKALLLFLGLTFLFGGEAFSQYYGQTSLEKSFEQNDLFFQPSYISPYDIGSTALSTPGVIDDPFLNLQVNPAWFSTDSGGTNHLYVDFRSYRQTSTLYQPAYPTYYTNGISSVAQPVIYPYFYVNSEPIIEPILSAAFLTNPLPTTMPGLFIGVTYQAIMQDSKYYSIPFDIYQSYLGYDYTGASVANSSSIPITTVSSGQDNMHHSGNLFALYAGYEVTPDIKLGLRLGRVLLNENGSYGDNNYWDNYAYGSGSSLYYSMESRDQDYNHWDLSGGIEYKIAPQTTVGVAAGYLWANVKQNLVDIDTSYYVYSASNDLSTSSSRTTENWNHNGKTYYGGINLTTHLNDCQTIILLYQYDREDVSLNLASGVVDTSYYSYSYTYDTNYSNYLSNSTFLEQSGGGGSITQTSHRLLVSFRWKFNDAAELTLGGIVNIMNQQTNTDEPTIATGHSYYLTTGNSYNSLYYDTTSQNKDLQWSFGVKQWSFDIPVIFSYKFSDKLALLLGLDKQISEWKMTDQTLVIYNENFEDNSYSGLTNKSGYGELYVSPEQDISNVNTTFLAGLTVSPAKEFNVRLLLSPSVRASFEGVSVTNFQWWLGVNLYP
jgi:hypothetical protein